MRIGDQGFLLALIDAIVFIEERPAPVFSVGSNFIEAQLSKFDSVAVDHVHGIDAIDFIHQFALRGCTKHGSRFAKYVDQHRQAALPQ